MKRTALRSVQAIGVLIVLIVITAKPLVAKDQEVRIAVPGDIQTLNTLEMKNGNDIPVILHMHDILLRSNPITGEKEIKNSLSESLEMLPNNKSIKIRLRRDVKFHTGDPLTAHDVKFTYMQCLNPRNANLVAHQLNTIEKIDVIDDYNLIIHLWEPYAGWKHILWVGIASKKYYERVGRETFRRKPVGSGPFRFVEHKTGEYTLLEANPNYHLGAPSYRYLRFMIIPDETSRIAMLETGAVDLVDHISPHFVRRLNTRNNVVVKRTDRIPSLFYLTAKVNVFPILKDRKFCHAIQHAINRQELVDRVFFGEGYPLYTWASKYEIGFDPSLNFEYNPDKARELLKQSTYKPGTPIQLTFTNAISNANLIGMVIQKYLQNVGITVKLQQLESGVAATYYRNNDPRIGHMNIGSSPGSPDPSVRLRNTIHSRSKWNSYRDRPRQKELDALIDGQNDEMDEARRISMLKRIHQILMEDGAGAALFGLNLIYAHSDRIDYTWWGTSIKPYGLARTQIVK